MEILAGPPQRRAASRYLVLILGDRVTTPVKDEYEAAINHGKPIFAFVKDLTRTGTISRGIAHRPAKDAKYAHFTDAQDLHHRQFFNVFSVWLTVISTWSR